MFTKRGRQQEIRGYRAGFTLIELLVVVGIMAFLISIVIVVVRGVVGNARLAATKGTIRKIDGLLTKRMEAFQRVLVDQDKAKPSPSWPIYAEAARAEAGGDRELARVLGRKQLFRRYFYQPTDTIGPDYGIGYVVHGYNSGRPPGQELKNNESKADSSECLYYMIMKDVSAGTEAPEGDMFASAEIADTDQDGLLEFVDGWGEPLRFFRWPTRLLRPANDAVPQQFDPAPSGSDDSSWTYKFPLMANYGDASGAGPGILIDGLPAATLGPDLESEHGNPWANDPDDPQGKIHRLIVQNSGTASQKAQYIEENYHTSDTYHTPLIVSSGPDKALGIIDIRDDDGKDDDKSVYSGDRDDTVYVKWRGDLAQPKNDLASHEALLDNISNRNLRAGGN